MRFLAATFLFLSLIGPAAAQTPGSIVEYDLKWTGAQHSTHELAFDPHDGAVWVTGQNMYQVARVGTDGAVHHCTMPKNSGPHGIDFDPQGRLWVSLEFAGEIVRVGETTRPDGKCDIQQTIDVKLKVPGMAEPLNPSPHGITIDGTLWFTGKQIATAGVVRGSEILNFPLATVGAVPIYLAEGPDKNIWGTELVGNKILRVSPAGAVSEFPIPTPNSRPIAIVPGPDGHSMWFSEEAGDNLARIDMDGKITEYPIPRAGMNVILAGLAFDRDGNLWTQMYAAQPNYFDDVDHMVKLDKSVQQAPTGDLSRVPITYYRVPTKNTVMHRIKQGPDGDMWFTELNTDKLGRLFTGEGPVK